MQTAIIGDRVILPDGIRKAVVITGNGRIEAVLSELPEGFSGTIIDAGNNLVMAGVVDTHVHINEPGRTHWEGFDTATKAAVAGGVTTLADMPLNASPVTTTVAAFEQKLQSARQNLHANCGFWGGLVPNNETEIEGLISAGVLGFKAFLTHSGIDEFPNVTKEDLHKAMPLIAKHNLPLLVHCELSVDNGDWKRKDTRSYQHYLQSRPAAWEDNAIALMIRLCEQYRCRVHIVHLSSAQSLAQIAAAKAKGLPLTVETAQHYLYLAAEDIADGDTRFKCAPPIRSRANNEQLWQALQEGVIDFVATDHSPAPAGLKALDTGDFATAWGGIASLQFALPLLWTVACRYGATPVAISEWLCRAPAKLAGLQKGVIEVGYDADFVIWNEQESFLLKETVIHYRHKISPYMNHRLKGVVMQTIIGGNTVFYNGTFTQLHAGSIVTARS